MRFIEFTDYDGEPICINPAAIAYVTKDLETGNTFIHFTDGKRIYLNEGYEAVVSWLTGESTGK